MDNLAQLMVKDKFHNSLTESPKHHHMGHRKTPDIFQIKVSNHKMEV
ncbi:hypothetical protein M7I_6506 [Glarea lozoyensis 74030]|uniref:Uncharacterized protein n=1 Tax=Glarea lozoyensis (strain ATCC 74030 / MF5533) TaxID=1104152 RepID=H0EUR7_GLAL7|nr:hypothetical protein M7I_6506 [Glarea lozoyensis 74030]